MSSTIADTGARLSHRPGPPCARTSGTPDPRVSVHSPPRRSSATAPSLPARREAHREHLAAPALDVERAVELGLLDRVDVLRARAGDEPPAARPSSSAIQRP